MMNKKILTGTLAVVMALSAMSTGLTFADEVVTGTEGSEEVTIIKVKRLTEEEREAQKIEKDAEMQAVIDQYYPEISDEWNATKNSVESLKTEIGEYVKERTEAKKLDREEQSEERKENKEANKEARVKDKKEEGKTNLEGLTQEEIEAMKAERTPLTDEEKAANREEKRTDKQEGKDANLAEKEAAKTEKNEERKENAKVKREEIKAGAEEFDTAVDAGDEENIKLILDEKLAHMKTLLETMQTKFDEMKSTQE